MNAPHPSHAPFAHLAGKRVLVTGATGFLGRHLLPQLVAAGADVTCLTRASSRTDHLPQGVTVARADLATGDGVAQALGGQDILIHMAALLFGLNWQDYLRANTVAAQHLAAAIMSIRARRRALPRVVLVSSLAASGPADGMPGRNDEAIGAPVSAYGWSKYLVEQILGRAAGDKLVVLRPPIIYGSGDKGLLPVFRGIQKGVAALPGWKRPFPVSVVHARDAAQAILLLCRKDAHGVYHVNDGAQHTMRAFYEAAAQALDARPLFIPVPVPVLGMTALAATLWTRLLRRLGRASGDRAPNWNLDKYREARHAGWLCDASRLCQELGYAPTMSLAAGMTEAVNGYRAEGLL